MEVSGRCEAAGRAGLEYDTHQRREIADNRRRGALEVPDDSRAAYQSNRLHRGSRWRRVRTADCMHARHPVCRETLIGVLWTSDGAIGALRERVATYFPG